MGPLRGALGFHGLFEELKVGGEENLFSGVDDRYSKAIASENSRKLAVFLVEEFDLSDDLQLNGGVRLESFDREFESEISDRDDWTFSASGGISRGFGEGWIAKRLTSVIPSILETSELYSNGPHHGSETFRRWKPFLEYRIRDWFGNYFAAKLGNGQGNSPHFGLNLTITFTPIRHQSGILIWVNLFRIWFTLRRMRIFEDLKRRLIGG